MDDTAKKFGYILFMDTAANAPVSAGRRHVVGRRVEKVAECQCGGFVAFTAITADVGASAAAATIVVVVGTAPVFLVLLLGIVVGVMSESCQYGW